MAVINGNDKHPRQTGRITPVAGKGKAKTRIFLPTSNFEKLAEFGVLLQNVNAVFFDNSALQRTILAKTGLQAPKIDVSETFYQSAYAKARHYADNMGMPSMADDSGLMVYALEGAPGVKSNRYGAPEDDPAFALSWYDRNAYLLERMKGIKDRRAVMSVCYVLAKPFTAEALSWEASIAGEIALEQGGASGFGFDSVFFLPEKGKTLAQIPPEEQKDISHRDEVGRLIMADTDRIIKFLGEDYNEAC
jgi:XTP/dITP diphosphohydrolase